MGFVVETHIQIEQQYLSQTESIHMQLRHIQSFPSAVSIGERKNYIENQTPPNCNVK